MDELATIELVEGRLPLRKLEALPYLVSILITDAPENMALIYSYSDWLYQGSIEVHAPDPWPTASRRA